MLWELYIMIYNWLIVHIYVSVIYLLQKEMYIDTIISIVTVLLQPGTRGKTQ